jgi:hypothetical protein
VMLIIAVASAGAALGPARKFADTVAKAMSTSTTCTVTMDTGTHTSGYGMVAAALALNCLGIVIIALFAWVCKPPTPDVVTPTPPTQQVEAAVTAMDKHVTGRYGGQQSLAPPAPASALQQPDAAPPGFAPSAQPATSMPLQPMVMPYPGMATASAITPAGVTYSQTAAASAPVGGGFVEPSASQASKKAALRRGLVVSVAAALLMDCCRSWCCCCCV